MATKTRSLRRRFRAPELWFCVAIGGLGGCTDPEPRLGELPVVESHAASSSESADETSRDEAASIGAPTSIAIEYPDEQEAGAAEKAARSDVHTSSAAAKTEGQDPMRHEELGGFGDCAMAPL